MKPGRERKPALSGAGEAAPGLRQVGGGAGPGGAGPGEGRGRRGGNR